ncbi:histidine phosphatase family protein [Streptomyces sp. NPDC051561]|uniref:histidine phosphatase family protein n=1 Tax=Streptomyces sp. NPDC051561 TaxID=3365658 RepID=UPI0037B6640F
MDTPATLQPRHLYLVRHAEATPDETGLSETGRRQAALLGQRLRGIPLSAIHHGPLPRAAETARLIAEGMGEQLPDGVKPQVAEPAGDYVPYEPKRADFPEGIDAGRYLEFVAQFPPEERERGPELAAQALDLYTGPVQGIQPRHELLVTHNFLAGQIMRAAHDAPAWRWLGINFANAALTVIRYAPGRPDTVLLFNDTGHLPPEIRWTGVPPELHI